ncbi:hypothetical protein [Mitsuokella multacida]|uniref:hypothetical protein n=1 Tax=Mitsuokella multacida TaxID=52226 RepID=UPI0039F57645
MSEKQPNEQNDEIQEFSAGSMTGDATKIVDTDALVKADEPTADNLQIYISSQIIETWKTQHDSDIELRRKYAKYLLIILAIESALMLGIFFGIGMRWLVYTETTVQLFLTLSVGQIIGAIYIIVKYLFSKDSHVILRDIADVLGRIHK